MEINKENLIKIKGGVKMSAALITSLYKSFTFIFDLGKYMGTAIRRIKTKNLCS